MMTSKRELDPAAEAVFKTIRSRRTVRDFTDEAVSVADLRLIIEAARWASSAGNRRLHRFLISRNPKTIDLISKVGPGFYGKPTAVVIVMTDLHHLEDQRVQLHDLTTWIDVGTAAMNMQLAAHALGLGSTPVTSFSRSGVHAVLNLPDNLVPELILQLGHPRKPSGTARRRGARITVDDLADWEVVGGAIPADDG